ncbi:hypothetical protein [Pacificispira sp.]|uniref:hypothetical protein n=1 Tax=Pacificispira sp. TaxID=2888761 RepID=UPI003BAD0EFE
MKRFASLTAALILTGAIASPVLAQNALVTQSVTPAITQNIVQAIQDRTREALADESDRMSDASTSDESTTTATATTE